MRQPLAFCWGKSDTCEDDIPTEEFTSDCSQAHKQGQPDLPSKSAISEGKVPPTVRFRTGLNHRRTSDGRADIYPGQLVRGVFPSVSLLNRIQDLGGGDVPFGLCKPGEPTSSPSPPSPSALQALQSQLTRRSGPLQSGLPVAAELSVGSLHVRRSLMEDRGGTPEDRRTTRKAGNHWRVSSRRTASRDPPRQLAQRRFRSDHLSL